MQCDRNEGGELSSLELCNYLLVNYDYQEKKPKFSVVKGIHSSKVREVFDRPWKPKGSDKVYFHKGCTVPRVKVRKFFQCKRDPEKADVRFFNPEDLSLSASDINYIGQLDLLPKPCKKFFIKYLHEEHKVLVKSLIKSFNIKEIYMGASIPYTRPIGVKYPFADEMHHTYNKQHTIQNCIAFLDKVAWYHSESRYRYYYRWPFYDHPPQSILEIRKVPHNLYTEKQILPYINEGSVTIDFERYKGLRQLLSGTDSDRKIAMEVMANCNYKESELYLYLLIHENLGSWGNTRIMNVNIQGMLKYLGIEASNRGLANYHYTSRTRISKKLYTKYKDTLDSTQLKLLECYDKVLKFEMELK